MQRRSYCNTAARFAGSCGPTEKPGEGMCHGWVLPVKAYMCLFVHDDNEINSGKSDFYLFQQIDKKKRNRNFIFYVVQLFEAITVMKKL